MSNYKIPELKYSYDALEPHIDAKTMEIPRFSYAPLFSFASLDLENSQKPP